ncbi:MAG TPA: CocE/NonD family hydrolase [Fimbriimonadaceae bacterium]|nr:CocE/NonD family hydrolase [Fimbriimonadaceae bacterium]
MRGLSLLVLALWSGLASAEPVTYVITQNGTKIGTNVFERKSDGSFTSSTVIEVAGIKITSDLDGKFVVGKLSSYQLMQKQPSVELTISHANGKSSAVVNGKAQPATPITLGTRLFGNYHPGICAAIFANLSTEVIGPQKVKLTVLDNGGAQVDASVVPGSPRTVKMGANSVKVRPYVLDLGGLKVDFVLDEDGRTVGESVASQKVSFVDTRYAEVFVDPVSRYKELSQPTFEPQVVSGVAIPMRDGVKLMHDMARPSAEGKYATILVRTPYGRTSNMLGAEWWAERGYIYIVQDTRGRHDSGGKFDPFTTERKDGKDTIDWIAKQPWSNGKVGMIGGSYSGMVQWAAAVEHPAALKCIVPQVSPPDAMLNLPYDHGVFMLLPSLWWSNLVRDRVSHMERAIQPLPHPDKLKTLPLSKVDDAVLGVNVPFFDEWLKREGMNAWKSKFDFVSDLPGVKIPALNISGWWDGDGIGTKTIWAKMRDSGHKNQWLIYGPWPHAFNTSTKFGDIDYGLGSVLELDSVYLRWFDTWLKDKQVNWNVTPKVQAFVTGANHWELLSDWPDPKTTASTYYFANGKDLVTKPSGSGKSSTFTYDPKAVNLPDLSNVNLMSGGTTIIGIKSKKNDLLVFKTPPLSAPTTVTGPISVDLYFSTNVVSTDFFATLVDIDEKGVARLVALPGKIDVRYLAGMDKPRLISPGKTYRAKIDIWDTAHEFAKGHRIGVVINSEMFPSYARNLNTGEPIYSATKMKVAKQIIYQDAKRPSALHFRILP